MANSPAKKSATTDVLRRTSGTAVNNTTVLRANPIKRKRVPEVARNQFSSSSHGMGRPVSSSVAKAPSATPSIRASQPISTKIASKAARFNEGQSGLYEWTGDQYQRFCSGMQWVGHVVDADGGRPAHVLDIWTLNGVCKRIEVPHELLNLPHELTRHLTVQGARLARTKHTTRQIGDYLFSRPTKPTYTRIVRDGWQAVGDCKAYVLDNNAFSASQLEVHIMRAPGTTNRKQSGTLAQWQEIVKLCGGNPLLILSLCAAFASALLHPFGRNAFGISLVGRSSTGKTTALRLALALFDSPSKLATWASTANGLEALASQCMHMPLILDEIGLASHDVMSDAAYRLTNGSGKLRAARDGTLASATRISSVSISSGEESIIEHIEHSGRQAKLGQFARFISLNSDFAYGTFANLHGFKNGAAFAERLNFLLYATHGIAWEPFVKYLAKNADALIELHAQRETDNKAYLTDGIQFDFADGVSARVLDNFALMLRAGKVAQQSKVLPLSDTELRGALRQCFRKWVARYRLHLLSPHESIRNDVCYFLQKHWHKLHRLSDYGNTDRNTSIGFACSLKGGKEVFLIFPGSLEALKKKHGHETFHRALIDAGWLLPGSENRPTQQRRLPAGGRTGMYVFSKSAVFG